MYFITYPWCDCVRYLLKSYNNPAFKQPLRELLLVPMDDVTEEPEGPSATGVR